MPQATRRRTQAANRARAALPRRRRPTAGETWARRGTVMIGVLVVVSLVVGLVVANGDLVPTGDAAGASSRATARPDQRRNDPNALIAAATRTPGDAETIGALADYYDQTGQFAAALPLYLRYLQLRPDDARVRVQAGDLLLEGGDVPGAQSQFAGAIALMPADPVAARAHLGLGTAYGALMPPRLADAIAQFTRASALDPTGATGDTARERLAALQRQYGGGVTVVVPTLPRPAP